MIDAEQTTISDDADGFGWKKYYNLDAIYSWLDKLLKKYPNQLTNYNYGKSHEDRTLRAVKVSHKKVSENAKKIADLEISNSEFEEVSSHFTQIPFANWEILSSLTFLRVPGESHRFH